MTLDNYIKNYDISYDPKKWKLSIIDEDDNVYASTSFTWKDQVYNYIFIAQLEIDEKGKVAASKAHLVYMTGKILYSDNYAKQYLKTHSLGK